MRIKSLALGLAFTLTSLSVSADQESVTLRFSNIAGPTSFMTTDLFGQYFQEIEERTNGQLKIKMFSGGTLVNARDTFDAVKNGLVDMAWGVTSYTPGRFRESEVVEVPLYANNIYEASTGLWTLYENNLLTGFEDVYVFAIVSSGIQRLHSTKPLESFEALEGDRYRAAGPLAAKALEAFDADPVALTVPSIAENLSKNVLTGSINDWNAVFTWGIADYVKWHLDVPFGSSPVFITINKRTYQSLPADVRQVLDDMGGRNFIRYWSESLGGENERLREQVASSSEDVITVPSEQEVETWRARLTPVINDWAESVDNGQQVWATYIEAVEDARQQ
ncbi:TRAP transporter substrate-binding protein [Marinobacter zhejiangensis]|uniref:TRAP-type C4-dicarboxylate transport system, substrate-binding protein n=1 Tax=Marinobacter zhejiangensis TaxID=488535 RepID=A0A1I4T5A7_9GAMM|nr:TRAP transporter substrate-binding protein [Marinobacter zhejiangensis]SFM71740.1 TRAP-type C4-dicarboxylate transport system, substrate-binding protein [Marinobacter zhejiangensis]